ncbi:MAG: hypothetical protein DMF56_07740 [Acidobacteria bacterium]|nr:MAG: hypothetical protein DMF56_07740 [Acidobacteriota bacterium]
MRFALSLLLVLLGVVFRVAPHPWNFAPVGAIALFAGATFDDRRSAFIVPLATMFIGDLFIGLHSLMPVIYATYALIVILGMLLRKHISLSEAKDLRGRDLSPFSRLRMTGWIASASVASSILFFITTNFAVWLSGMTYAKTFDGLVACYVAAIPFFDRTLASDLLFSAIFFGAFALAERRLNVPANRVAASKRN